MIVTLPTFEAAILGPGLVTPFSQKLSTIPSRTLGCLLIHTTEHLFFKGMFVETFRTHALKLADAVDHRVTICPDYMPLSYYCHPLFLPLHHRLNIYRSCSLSCTPLQALSNTTDYIISIPTLLIIASNILFLGRPGALFNPEIWN